MGKATVTSDALRRRELSTAESATIDVAIGMESDLEITLDGHIVKPRTSMTPEQEVMQSDVKPWD